MFGEQEVDMMLEEVKLVDNLKDWYDCLI